MAAIMAELNCAKPPLFIERILLLVLSARDRESISGDLLEEYREEKLPALGSVRANYWYLRQIIGFATIQIGEGGRLKQLLTLTCFFTIAASTWLAVMENILRHHGYQGRTAIAVLIGVQSLGTLLAMLVNARFAVRLVVMLGAVAVASLGIAAFVRTSQATHFEGFVLIIGSALLLQGALTVGALSKTPQQI